LNIDTTRQCQLGRRIAPPVIATFELAHAFLTKVKRLRRNLRSRFCLSSSCWATDGQHKL